MTFAVANRQIFPFELEAIEVVSPENSLRICMARIQRSKAIKAVFLGWPNLEAICKKLARMITHGYPCNHREQDLLSAVLDRAMLAYEQASTSARDENALGDAFMRAILFEAAYLTDFEVHGMSDKGKTEYWEPLSLPLCDWVRKKEVERLVFSPRTLLADEGERYATRLVLAGQILAVSDARRMAGRLENGVA